MELFLVLLLAFRSVPDDVSAFSMEQTTNHVVTFTCTSTNTWRSTGPTPEEDDATYRVAGTTLFVAQPDEVAITPDAAWGLTPQTSLRDLTTLKHPDGTTITIDRSSSGLDFRIRRPGRKEKALRVQWKK